MQGRARWLATLLSGTKTRAPSKSNVAQLPVFGRQVKEIAGACADAAPWAVTLLKVGWAAQ